jgi:hypothetical protein
MFGQLPEVWLWLGVVEGVVVVAVAEPFVVVLELEPLAA